MTTKASASSRSAGRGAKKSVPIKAITADAFDALADAGGDISTYMDHEKSIRPGRPMQRVNVDFPTDLLRAIDVEATRIGVSRQAFIKLRLADLCAPTTTAAPASIVQLMEALRHSLDNMNRAPRARRKSTAA